jgi:hypothetical protein
MTISRNLSTLAESASSSGVLGIASSWVIKDLGPDQIAAMEAQISDMIANAPRPG